MLANRFPRPTALLLLGVVTTEWVLRKLSHLK